MQRNLRKLSLSLLAGADATAAVVPAPRFFNRPLARPAADAENGTVRRRSERRQRRSHASEGER